MIASRLFAFFTLVLFAGSAFAQQKKNPVFAPVEDNPDLPRVLLIGDSISIGYTLAVREKLDGIANLHRIPSNAGHTGMGLENLDKWLETRGGEWDVIHFNWGLWDLCYRNPESKNQGRRDKVNGTITHTVGQYAETLDELVTKLKQTGAHLIFATTTPVPEGEAGRKVGDDLNYNAAAIEVMKKHGVEINDLHMVMADKMEQYGTKPGDVHFTEEGSDRLADQVAGVIDGALRIDEDGTRTLFDGTRLGPYWEFTPGGWEIEKDGSMVCRMKDGKDRKGNPKKVGMGNIWSRQEYGDFDLTLSYKLSEGANSGVFYRVNDKANPVQDGLEVQLMDNDGFQESHGPRDDRKLNASFYDAKAPSKDAQNPIGEWNTMRITCQGPKIQIAVNGEQVIDVNIDDWDTPGKNPDGTTNKFKKALEDYARSGKIGFQNHGQVVWFKDVKIKVL